MECRQAGPAACRLAARSEAQRPCNPLQHAHRGPSLSRVTCCASLLACCRSRSSCSCAAALSAASRSSCVAARGGQEGGAVRGWALLMRHDLAPSLHCTQPWRAACTARTARTACAACAATNLRLLQVEHVSHVFEPPLQLRDLTARAVRHLALQAAHLCSAVRPSAGRRGGRLSGQGQRQGAHGR